MVSIMTLVYLAVKYALGASYNPTWLLAAIAVDLIIFWFMGGFDTHKPEE